MGLTAMVISPFVFFSPLSLGRSHRAGIWIHDELRRAHWRRFRLRLARLTCRVSVVVLANHADDDALNMHALGGFDDGLISWIGRLQPDLVGFSIKALH